MWLLNTAFDGADAAFTLDEDDAEVEGGLEDDGPESNVQKWTPKELEEQREYANTDAHTGSEVVLRDKDEVSKVRWPLVLYGLPIPHSP